LQSSADGNAITYLGEDFYLSKLGNLNQYISRRDTQGWSTANLTPGVPSTSETAVERNLHVGFAPDLSAGVIQTESPLSEGQLAGYINLYITRESSTVPALTVQPPNQTPVSYRARFAGGNAGSGTSAPFTHVLFSANDAVTPEAVYSSAKDNLYEWSEGQLHAVNVLPGQTESDPGASFGRDEVIETTDLPSFSNAISADGSRVFWTDQNNGNLYVREDGESTTQVDAAVGGGGQFETASTDGSKVLFIKAGHLYLYDVETKNTMDLAEGGGVEGILGASDDASHAYYVSNSVLTGEEKNAQGEQATGGQPNLYVWAGGATKYITTLSPADNSMSKYTTQKILGDWFSSFAGRTARVSPDGRYAAFMSVRPLTGYDNRQADNPAKSLSEIFLYDSLSGGVACASCNADGSRPNASSPLPAPVNGEYQQRYLNDAGELFFSTTDRVAPGDTNNAADVYEFSSGRAHLLSPGNTEDEAVFADASESGKDVFFTTRQRLVGADGDSIVDLYDARVGGGIASQNAPPPLQCLGEGCKPPATELPFSASPGSSSFVGPENPPAAFHNKKVTKSTTKTRHKKRPHKKARKKTKRKSGKKSNVTRVVKRGGGGAR
jgi:hypothetical protein